MDEKNSVMSLMQEQFGSGGKGDMHGMSQKYMESKVKKRCNNNLAFEVPPMHQYMILWKYK
jgi:hypothetical protein